MPNKKKPLQQNADPRWKSPAAPAPGNLRIVQAFLGTAPAWKSPEELVTPETLAAWLELWDLIPRGTELRRKHLWRMLEVRENLRALLRARYGRAAPEAAKALELEADQALVRATFDADGGIRYRTEIQGLDGALAKIFDAVHSAQRDGSWTLLKLCADPRCGRAFYDYSRGGQGKWCQSSCGSRQNAATFRRRHPRQFRF